MSQHTPRTITAEIEASIRQSATRNQGFLRALLIELDAERAVSAELLEACKAQHKAIDALLAMLIDRDASFFPTKSGVWPYVPQGIAAIHKAESSPSDSQGSA